MLDKSVPYAGFFMRRPAGAPITPYTVPDGYAFVFYRDGYEAAWARIEASVLEFDSEFAALLYFKRKYLPQRGDLSRRCLFIEDGEGSVIATATAWRETVKGDALPWLSWVGVMPEHQGRGVGKALISRAAELLAELEGGRDIYLHTQTWSYKAVGIYKSLGFEPTSETRLYTSRRDNLKRALRILAQSNEA